MSVYTTVEREELDTFLAHYSVGELVEYEGISAGIENTNYFVTTTQGRFVLTLFEQHEFDELGYFLDLMAFFADGGVPSARPIADNAGAFLRHLCDKPAALVERLQGRDIKNPNIEQCRIMGETLAQLHLLSPNFTQHRVNTRGHVWRMETAERLLDRIPEEEGKALLQAELNYQQQHWSNHLASGVVHADLFRDNALFHDGKLAGVIDFYYACNDAFVYDLAVLLNDWCCTDSGGMEEARFNAMLHAYQAVRPLPEEEKASFNTMLRAAALRFWLSRLQDKLFPKEGELTQIKDPSEFHAILNYHVSNNTQLPEFNTTS